MTSWVLMIFFLGLVALVVNLFNVFAWFTPWWGIILMGVSFGMLTRIWKKEREGEKEKLVERIQDLEAQIAKLKGEHV